MVADDGVTVTLAVLENDPLVAVTTCGPPAEVALNKPAALMVPPPLADQAKDDGWLAMAMLNWSSKVALKTWVAPTGRETAAGVTSRPEVV